MGNTLIEDKGRINLMKSYDAYVEETPELNVRNAYFFENKLFKTISYKCHKMMLVVKVHLMRKRLSCQEAFIHNSNFLYLQTTLGNRLLPFMPFSKTINFEDARPAHEQENQEITKDFLAVSRQQLSYTLEERHPIPKSSINFITMQILNAIVILHSKKLYHGNLRSSNVLLTSSDHVYLTDFASYKPYFLMEDQLGEFRNLFESSILKCNIAPEKFQSSAENQIPLMLLAELPKQLLQNLQAMDMFSMGCLLFEIYSGDSLFTREQLIQYKKGVYDPLQMIGKIESQPVRELIANLISLDPAQRPTALDAFQIFYQKLNPRYELIYYLSCAMSWSQHFMLPDLRIGLMRKLLPQILNDFAGEKPQFKYPLPLPIQKLNINKFYQLIKDIDFPSKSIALEEQHHKSSYQYTQESISQDQFENMNNLIIKEFKQCIIEFQNSDQPHIVESVDRMRMSQVQQLQQSLRQSLSPVRIAQSRKERQSLTLLKGQVANNQEIILFTNLLFNQIRCARYMQSKLCALEMIELFVTLQDDQTNYYNTLPLISAMFEDTENQVVCLAFEIFLKILNNLAKPVEKQMDIQLFVLFVWNQINKVLKMEDPLINRFIAAKSYEIAVVINKFQQQIQKWLTDNPDNKVQGVKDYQLEFQELLFQNLSNSKITEAQSLIIQNIGAILKLFSNIDINTKDLPQKYEQLAKLISSFNNQDLKSTMINATPEIFSFYRNVPTYEKILLLSLNLSIGNDLQLFYTVRALRRIAEGDHFSYEQEVEYVKQLVPLLMFPNKWIQNEVLLLLAQLFSKYTPIDVYFKFQPHIKKFIKEDVAYLDIDIIKMLICDPLNHKSQTDLSQGSFHYMLPSNLSQREIEIYEHYYMTYLKNVQKFQDKEEIDLKYRERLDFINRKNENLVSIMNRINEFVSQAVNQNLVRQIMDSEIEEQMLPSRKLNQDGREFSIIKKIKYLQIFSMNVTLSKQNEISYNPSSTYHRNILNSLLTINSLELRTRQYQPKDEIQLNRNLSFQPPRMPFRVGGNLITTINEHKDIVTAVENMRDQRFFLSTSYDGTIKIYDFNKIDVDFTSGSCETIRGQDKDDISNRKTALRAIEGTDSFIVGGYSGQVSLYSINNGSTKQIRTFLNADSEIKKIDSLKNEMSENVFIYVTLNGSLHVEDIRQKQTQKFQIGRERGLVSNMVQSKNLLTYISTINGYLIIYDIRCSLTQSVFQILNHDEQPLPIFSLCNFNRVTYLEGVQAYDFIGIGYQSNNNEVGFWDVNDLSDNISPQIYLGCYDKRTVIVQAPKLKNLSSSEKHANYNHNLSGRSYYDFVGSYQQLDIIAYLQDPLTSSLRTQRNKWLEQTSNLYANLKQAFEARNTVTTLLSVTNKNENTIVTSNTDKSVMSWTLQNDSNKAGERCFERENNTGIITSPYGQQRKFIQCKSGDVYVIQDFEDKKVRQFDSKTDHKDCITDMTFLERENYSILVTGSRDNTIKIWK